MMRVSVWKIGVVGALFVFIACESTGAAEVFAPLKPDEARDRIGVWLREQNSPEAQQQKVIAAWIGLDESVAADRMLDLVARSFAIVDQGAMKLVQECNSAPSGSSYPAGDVLNKPNSSPFFRANLSLYYGRSLVERRLFDEAWDVLKSVDPKQVVDPASLFFFQAVAAQGVLEIKPAVDAIEQLLTNTERVPVRYSATATLMQAELKGFQEKSLGEVARLMADSERRLELGRAGEKVQGVQERIISNLDEVIKKTEQEQQRQRQRKNDGSDDQGGNSNNPEDAADDSRVKGETGPGETDKKRFSDKGSWGNLPEKDLAKAKNDLNKNFPSHYEQAIEKYTKKLAARAAKKTK